MHDSTAQTVLFNSVYKKPVVAMFDQAHSSSDGGLVLLQAADKQLGLCAALAACAKDWRDRSRVQHSFLELLQQRVFGIACGYPDANDARGLAEDPLQKLAIGRDPIEGISLASQPTLSRFENGLGSRNLVKMFYALTDVVLKSARCRRSRVRRITLDFDPTDDATHGQQPLAFFHGYYDSYCYLPLVGTMTFDDDPEQYLLGALLRPGDASAHSGFESMMKRLLPRIRKAYPKARIVVRLDGGFASPEVLDFLESENLGYIVGLPANLLLAEEAADAMSTARAQAKHTAQTARVFGETQYQTEHTWAEARRVVYKAEVVCLAGREPRDNLRFVVTNLRNASSRVYDLYRQRGEMENRIKELKQGLQIDRTSCSSFLANQARVLLTAAAYVLMQAIRIAARGTQFAHAQVWILRERLLKLAVWIERSVRRVVLHLPRMFPGRGAWIRTAKRLGACTA